MARLSSGKASRTARITAAMRYRHCLSGRTPLVFEDREAKLFVDLPSAFLLTPTPLSDWAFGKLLGPIRGLEGEVLARSRYVEEVLAEKLAAGLPQMLVLGAGFDTTALRHAGADCRFFEVDHPATQSEKRAILARHPEVKHSTTYVPVDFATDDLVQALDNAGFDRTAETLVSWLGVTMYLTQDAVFGTLSALRDVLKPGSELVFDAYPRDKDLPAEDKALFAATRAYTASRGEPMVPWFAVDAFERLLDGTGWKLAEMLDGEDMRQRWFTHQPAILQPPRGARFCRLVAV